jgi:hypothetical protein
VRTCSSKCAPRWVQRICCFLTIRWLITGFTVDSTNADEIVSPWRYRSPSLGMNAWLTSIVVMEFAHGLEQLRLPLRWVDARVEVALQILDDLQGPVDIAMPEMPFQALQLLLQPGHVPPIHLVVSRRSRGGPLQGHPFEGGRMYPQAQSPQ